jgi:hypothetical protein
MRVWKVAVAGLMAIGLIALVSAQPFGIACGAMQTKSCGCWANYNVSYDEIAQKAMDILSNAQLDRCPYCNHYAIVKDGRIVGMLWQNVDLSNVEIGQPCIARWGARVPLMYDGHIVGQLFIDGVPFGWQKGHHCWRIQNS